MEVIQVAGAMFLAIAAACLVGFTVQLVLLLRTIREAVDRMEPPAAAKDA